MSWSVIIQAIFLIVAYSIILYLVMLVWKDHEIAQFDPYLILEIPRDAGDKAIRKVGLPFLEVVVVIVVVVVCASSS